MTGSDVLGVDEVGGCSAVHEPVNGKLRSIVSGLNFQRKVERVGAGVRSNRVALGKLALLRRLARGTRDRGNRGNRGHQIRGNRGDRGLYQVIM